MSTPPGPFASPESAALRPIQMVSVAVGMGALMLSAVRILVDPSAPLPSPWAVGIVLATLVGSATLIRYVGYAVPALPHGLPRENAETTSLRYFTSTTTLRTALAEAPVLVAFACSFVFTPHSWLTLLIALPGGLALFWVHGWPSPRTAAAVEAGLEADGAESWLSEALGFR
ncbi:hypothetical protein ASE25_19925 [Terrabacter sp. Root85]|uniref:hypothetical protein n=1 Tax=unclassified Terrabacter TaxID=2630222 RepID=UPI000702076E|nr:MULTISPECIES: hypothetical protein [unclassified Terrabacter]KRC85306.1 hypothetical protein ASE25_19925 [Terrabacter sp. Root85]KRF44470.1 hypothetical protein ASH01_10690 [Terrabacter sp. Soil811]